MGYLKDLYGYQDKRFISGFLAAMDCYAVWMNGKRFIGSPEKELKSAMRNAVEELAEIPEDFDHTIDRYF